VQRVSKNDRPVKQLKKGEMGRERRRGGSSKKIISTRDFLERKIFTAQKRSYEEEAGKKETCGGKKTTSARFHEMTTGENHGRVGRGRGEGREEKHRKGGRGPLNGRNRQEREKKIENSSKKIVRRGT